MKLKRRISDWVAARFLGEYRRRLRNEAPWSVPWSVWRRIPRSMRHWAEYQVLAPGEEAARRRVGDHDVLGCLPDNRHNGFAITPAAMLYLWNMVNVRRPQRILEFGSGLSTRIFAAYAARQKAGPRVTICTVEHDEAWLEDVRRSLESDGVAEHVELIHAPLSPWTWGGATLTCYGVAAERLQAAAAPGGFDVCFIDGPPRTVGRFGCFPLAEPHLADGAIVLLDDCLRSEEQAVLQRLGGTMKDRFTPPRVMLVDAHGMAVLRHRSVANSQGTSECPQCTPPAELGKSTKSLRSDVVEDVSVRATVTVGNSGGSAT